MLKSVCYIPRLRSNIISIGHLDEVGVKTIVEHECMVLSDQGKVVAKMKRTPNRLYILQATRAQPVCLMAKYDEGEWLWHARFGHVNFITLREISEQNLVEGMPHIDDMEQV